MEDNQAREQYKKVKSLTLRLEELLNKGKIEKIYYSSDYIVINFLKDCTITIVNKASNRKLFNIDYKYIIIFDRDFKFLSLFLDNKRKKEDMVDCYWYFKVLDFLSTKYNKKQYWDLPSLEIKKSFCERYNLKKENVLDKEFFIFGGSDFSWRYNRKRKPLKIGEDGVEVILKDNHSFLFESLEDSSRRFIDCENSTYTGYWLKNGNVILNRNCIVLTEFNNKLKYKLKKGIKIKDCEHFSVKSLYNKKLKLIKKGKKYFLKDKKGEISISHPDLLLLLV